jgi:hypothetical protein
MEVMMKVSFALGALTFPVLFISNLLAIWLVAYRTGVWDNKLVFARKS